MPASAPPHLPSLHPPTPATLVARSVSAIRGGRTVLDGVSLTVGPDSVHRGDRTQRRRQVDPAAPAGRPRRSRTPASVTLDPPSATVGYLAQEHEQVPGETVRRTLTRRTGAQDGRGRAGRGRRRAGRRAPGRPRTATPSPSSDSPRSERATSTPGSTPSSTTWDSGPPWPTGRRPPCRVARRPRWPWPPSSCRGSRSPCSTSPPTTSTSTGSQRLQAVGRATHRAAWSSSPTTGPSSSAPYRPCSSSTSTTTRPGSSAAAGPATRPSGPPPGATPRRPTRPIERRRTELQERAQQQRQWATKGVAREARPPRDNDKAQRDFRVNRTEKLASKARRTERALAALDEVAKPWEGWDLRFTIEEADRAGRVVARLRGAVVERGTFRLGPVDLEIDWGDRLGLTGANGSGQVDAGGGRPRRPSPGGRRAVARAERGARGAGPGPSDARRRARPGPGGVRPVRARPCPRPARCWPSSGSRPSRSPARPARCRRESGPGPSWPRSRRSGVNFLVLDEPTNHLDLPAIEQLESALRAFHRDPAAGLPRPPAARVGGADPDGAVGRRSTGLTGPIAARRRRYGSARRSGRWLPTA